MSGRLRRAAGDLLRALARAGRPAPADLFRRTEPASRQFGLDRGTPVDRYYIEAFLRERAELIRGRVMEVGECRYSRQLGGDRVRECVALHARAEGGPGLVQGDLADPRTLPGGGFDCFVCTQTLNFIYDVHAAARGAHHVLVPGGRLLCTVAGISQVSRYDAERWGDYWRFTPDALRRLLEPAFGSGVEVRAYGNLLAATALLHGMAVEDLSDPRALDAHDPDYPVIVAAMARKSA